MRGNHNSARHGAFYCTQTTTHNGKTVMSNALVSEAAHCSALSDAAPDKLADSATSSLGHRGQRARQHDAVWQQTGHIHALPTCWTSRSLLFVR